MKKLLFLSLLLLPIFAKAQFSVSAIGGDNGYAAMRAEYYYKASPEFAITPKYSFYQDNDTVNMISRFGLRLDYMPTYKLDFGLEGSFIPATNGYSSYSASADGKYYLLKGERGLVSSLYLGAGGDFINHKQDVGFQDQNNIPLSDYDINEIRAKLMAGADISILQVRAVFSKALDFSETPTGREVIWEDIPFMTSVDKSFIDYSLGAAVIVPLEIINLYTSYSTYKYKAFDYTSQSLNAGATLTIIGGMGITGNVEFRDFDKENSQIYYSLSGSLAL